MRKVVLIVMFPVALFGRHWIVSKTADTLRGEFLRIMDAVQYVAKAGDTVIVKPGIYKERIILPSGVIFVSEKPGSAIIEYAGEGPCVSGKDLMSGALIGFKIIRKDSLKEPIIFLENSYFLIKNCEIGGGQLCGIASEGGSLTCDNCKISENKGTGMVLNGGEHKISNTEIRNNKIGIEISKDAKIKIEKCKIENNEEIGIYATNSKVEFVENVIKANGKSGMRLEMCKETEIKKNEITENNREGLLVLNSKDIKVYGNNIYKNKKYGIRATESEAEIKSNLLKENIEGIRIVHSRCLIDSNSIETNSKFGINISTCDSIVVKNNLIKNNKSHGILCKYSHSVKIERNTLSDNKNGIYARNSSGEIMYNVISGNSRYGIYCRTNSKFLIKNNTIVKNRFSGVFAIEGAEVNLVNNIIALNGWGIVTVTEGYTPGTAHTEFNCVWSNKNANYAGITDTTKNIRKNPLFVNPENDFRLRKNSPCIGKGKNGENIGAF